MARKGHVGRNTYGSRTKTTCSRSGTKETEDRITEVLRVADGHLLADVDEDGLMRVLYNITAVSSREAAAQYELAYPEEPRDAGHHRREQRPPNGPKGR